MTLLDVSCGSQVPSLALYPSGKLDYSLADASLDWLDAVGLTLFDWQRHVLRSALARRGNRWAAYEVTLVVPRQNGKNEILVALELLGVTLLGRRLVVHSAHEAATAEKHFARFRELVNEESPQYRPEIDKLMPRTKTKGFFTANGKEHIEFANGARIDFKTRTKRAARGFSSPLVVLDEAFNLPQAAVGSLQYTMRAKPGAQFWKTSSAAHADSDVLHNDRRRALAADPENSAFLYLEWGNEIGVDPSDPAAWLRSNPSTGCVAPGFELELQTFRNEYQSAKDDPLLLAEFVREVCGVPEPPLSESRVISPESWEALKVKDSKIVSNDQWALAVSSSREWAQIGLAGRTADGRLHVERYKRRAEIDGTARPMDGIRWVVDECVHIWEHKRIPVRIHKAGPEASFIAPLRERGVEVVEVSTPEVSQAVGQFIDAANGGQLSHIGQASLTKALMGADRKPTGDGAVLWSRRSSVEITPLVAVTVALGGVPQDPVYTGDFFVDLDDFDDD